MGLVLGVIGVLSGWKGWLPRYWPATTSQMEKGAAGGRPLEPSQVFFSNVGPDYSAAGRAAETLLRVVTRAVQDRYNHRWLMAVSQFIASRHSTVVAFSEIVCPQAFSNVVSDLLELLEWMQDRRDVPQLILFSALVQFPARSAQRAPMIGLGPMMTG